MAKFVEETEELKAKVEKLEDENKALRELLRFKGNLVRVSGSTFLEGDDDPICGRCAEVDNQAVHIHKPAMAVPE